MQYIIIVNTQFQEGADMFKTEHKVSLIVEAFIKGQITLDEARIELDKVAPKKVADLIIRALNRAIQTPGWNNDNTTE